MKKYPLLPSAEPKLAKTVRFTKETFDLWEELKRLRHYDIPQIARIAIHEALSELKHQHDQGNVEFEKGF